MMKHFFQNRSLFLILSGLALLLVSLVGCRLEEWNDRTPTTPGGASTPAEVSDLVNCIMGDPAITEWGAQYEEGNTYAMVNIPVSGALKVEYGIVNGGVFAIFLETTQPVELEIGLERHEVPENADSEVDVLDWVCVTYEEGAVFKSTPENVQRDVGREGAWTHYQRVDADGGVHPWWLPDAGFAFSGATQWQCVIGNRTVLVTEVPGPFPKPTPRRPDPVTAGTGCTRVTTCTPGAVLVSCIVVPPATECFDGADNTAACRATTPYTGAEGPPGAGWMRVPWNGAGGPAVAVRMEVLYKGAWVATAVGGTVPGLQRVTVRYSPGVLVGVRIVCGP